MNRLTGDAGPQARTGDYANAINTGGSLFILITKSPASQGSSWGSNLHSEDEKKWDLDQARTWGK